MVGVFVGLGSRLLMDPLDRRVGELGGGRVGLVCVLGLEYRWGSW